MSKLNPLKHIQDIQSANVSFAPPRARTNLGSAQACRKELIAVYREARAGELEPSTATRLAYLLQTIVAMIRDNELEDRIAALETGGEHK